MIKNNNGELEVNMGLKGVAMAALLAIGGLYGVAGYESLELNESGIQVVMLGSDKGSTIEMTPGMQWVDPIMNDVFIYDTRSRQYEIPSVSSETADGQPIVADVSLEIRLVAADIAALHKNIGKNWYEEVVYPAARKFIRVNTSSVSSDAIYTGNGKRQVSNGIAKDLAYLTERGIDVTVNLRNVEFTNPAFIQSLEAKAVATQNEIIAKRNALADIERAKGVVNTAEGQKQKRIKEAEAGKAEQELRGIGSRLEKEQEAKGLLAMLKAKAAGTKLQVQAYGGGEYYAQVKVAEAMGDNFQIYGIPTGAPGTTSVMGLDKLLGKAVGVTDAR